MLISVIVPCFNEQEVIRETYAQISATLVNDGSLEYEFLFIDDGSGDATPAILREIVRQDARVKIVALSRNFGHQPAVSAGIRTARGNLAVIIDADLQDPPGVIPDMIRQLRDTGSNVVYGVRKRRKGENPVYLLTAKLFYIALNKLSEYPLPVDTGDFRVIDRKIIDAFNDLHENSKYIRGLISWMGFKQTPYFYDRNPRYAGRPKYTLTKLIRLATTGIFYFSKKPLRIATAFGFLSVGLGLLLSAWVIYGKFAYPDYTISGWTSMILVIIYFGGVQLLTIGILGHYIGSLFDEVKRRPEYIVAEEINFESSTTRK
jgi:glycosyltransferase involved in cell wall biosynthesis